MNNFLIFSLCYQLLIILFYNKAAKLFSYINKIGYFILIALSIYFEKIQNIENIFDMKLLTPIVLSCLLLLIYDTNKGFAQHSILNKYFPTILLFTVLITQVDKSDFLNYALIVSLAYDFLNVSRQGGSIKNKKFITPFFIITIQLIGPLFNFGINIDIVFSLYWIVLLRLFPFSILKKELTSKNDFYLSRCLLILNLSLGNIEFSNTSIILLCCATFLSISFMIFLKNEVQTLISYRSVMMSSALLMTILCNKTADSAFIVSVLWIDFYFLSLSFSRIESSIPYRINKELGNIVYYLLISGIIIGSSNFLIIEGLNIHIANHQLKLGILLIIPFLLSGVFYFSRKNYYSSIKESIRKIDHFDTFIAQLIIITGIVLSI